MSDPLRPHESQHARPPCPSPTPRVHSDSRPSSQWCHPAISSSVVPFSSCPQSPSASESFPMSQLFTWGGQSTGVSLIPFSEHCTALWLIVTRDFLSSRICSAFCDCSFPRGCSFVGVSSQPSLVRFHTVHKLIIWPQLKGSCLSFWAPSLFKPLFSEILSWRF